MNPTFTRSHATFPFSASFMDDTIQTTVDENKDRSDFVLHGIQQQQKAGILRVQHRRHIQAPGQNSDTKDRIFGGNSIENLQTTGDNANKDQKQEKPEEQAATAATRKPPVKSRNPLLDDSDDRPKHQPAKAATHNRRNISQFKIGGSPMPSQK